MARGGKKAGGGSAPWSSEQLASLLAEGAVFSMWMADYDASDLYPLRIEELGPDGSVTVSFPDGSARAILRCEAAAIEAGQGPVFLSQGSAIAGKVLSGQPQLRTDSHSPPFLLSRAALATLKDGQPVSIDVYSGRFSVTRRGEAVSTVRIGDEPITVRTIHAQDDSDSTWSPVDLWVLDHPKWPIILQIDFGGECELSLFEIKPAP